MAIFQAVLSERVPSHIQFTAGPCARNPISHIVNPKRYWPRFSFRDIASVLAAKSLIQDHEHWLTTPGVGPTGAISDRYFLCVHEFTIEEQLDRFSITLHSPRMEVLSPILVDRH